MIGTSLMNAAFRAAIVRYDRGGVAGGVDRTVGRLMGTISWIRDRPRQRERSCGVHNRFRNAREQNSDWSRAWTLRNETVADGGTP
jgi:hypothetical protein